MLSNKFRYCLNCVFLWTKLRTLQLTFFFWLKWSTFWGNFEKQNLTTIDSSIWNTKNFDSKTFASNNIRSSAKGRRFLNKMSIAFSRNWERLKSKFKLLPIVTWSMSRRRWRFARAIQCDQICRNFATLVNN